MRSASGAAQRFPLDRRPAGSRRLCRPGQAPDAEAPAGEPLTAQETRVALMVAQGLPNREVAAALFLSPKTVEHHLSNIFRKRGLRSRTELAALFAREAGR